jgi:hypothetical protein
VESATPRGRRTLPFAPLQAAIDHTNQSRNQSLHASLPESLRRAYHRANLEGGIPLRIAEDFCDHYGWHPRQIWGAEGAWDQLILGTQQRKLEDRRAKRHAAKARRKAAA